MVIFFDKMWVAHVGGSEKSRLLCGSVCVPQLFLQLSNTTRCLAFLRKFVSQPLCCVPLQIQAFCQNLVLVAEYHVDC